MILTKEILDELSAKATGSERLRMNLDLRTTENDSSQRMLNALEPGTKVPVHRHPTTSEVVILLRGSVRETFYDDNGTATESVILKAGQEPYAITIPAGTWHGIECLEAGTVLFEAKDGAFEPRKEEDIMDL